MNKLILIFAVPLYIAYFVILGLLNEIYSILVVQQELCYLQVCDQVFSRLHFIHGFRVILNLLCVCNIKAETTTHSFLCCHFYSASRSALKNNLNEIDSSFTTLNGNKFIGLIYKYLIDRFIRFDRQIDDKKNRYNVDP